MDYFIQCVLIMSQVTVTTTTVTQPVTVVCCGSSLITVTVMLGPTFVSQMTSGNHDMFLPPQLIMRNTVRGTAGLSTMPWQQQPQSQMPSHSISLTSRRGAQTKVKVGFQFNVQKWTKPESGASLPKKPPLGLKLDGH